MQLRKKRKLQRDLNPWPRDTGAMLINQLSYEAINVRSRLIISSHVPVHERDKMWQMYIIMFIRKEL